MALDRGFLKRYEAYSSEATDAAWLFHRAVGLALLSAVVGRNVYYRQGPLKVYPNLYILILGKSTLSRKTTAIRIGKNLLGSLPGHLVYPEDFSREAIIDSLADTPNGIFIFEEFASFLSVQNRDYMSGIKELLTQLYDSPEKYQRRLRKETTPIEIKDAAPTILAASTVQWLTKHFREEDLLGGFLVRFLFFPAERTRSLAHPPPLDANQKRALSEELQEIASVKGEASLDKVMTQIEEFHREVEVDLKYQANQPISGFLARAETAVKKIAVLLAIARGKSLIVEAADFEQATALYELLKNELRCLSRDELAFDKNGAQMNRVKQLIKEAGKEGIIKSKIMQALNLSAREMKASADTLLERDEVEVESVKRKTGRPGQKYVWREHVDRD